MTFKKPKDVTYTDMCRYIDDNIYTENFDESLVYEYLYHIIFMLGKQAALFDKHMYYDYFALFGANRVYFRLINKKQYMLKEDGTPKMEKIKSVLNYIKTTLYPMKVDFQQSEYSQKISKESHVDELSYNYDSLISRSVDRLNISDFELTLHDIPKTCRKFLKTIPYKYNSSEWNNIYVSVMLTFMNSITHSNKQLERLNKMKGTGRLRDKHVIESYDELRSIEPVLFHLDESWRDYIIVLSRQLKHIIAKDLSDILHTHVDSDFKLVQQSLVDYCNNKEEGDTY